jgi:hypothetical protein
MTEPSEHIPFLTQWRLVRSAIEHENTLKSHRVTWFLAAQLFLFTGFTTIFVEAVKNDILFKSLKVYAALVIVFCMGFYVCILAWANLRAAQKMIVRLQNWWLIHCHGTRDNLKAWILSAKYGEGQTNFPPVNGIFTSNLHIVFDEIQLPKALAIFWLILVFVTTIIFLQKRFGVPPLASLALLTFLGTLLFFKTKERIKNWLKTTSSKKATVFGQIFTKLGLENASGDLQSEIMDILNNHPC